MNRQLITRVICAGLLLLGGIGHNAAAVEEIIFYHNDALGSPVVATDENGAVRWREQYTPYGSRLLYEARETDCTPSPCSPVESLWDARQWYTGKLEESRQGLQYFGARWYEPELGRFLSVDPVEFHTGSVFSFNRYAYANNNPYRYVDPDGNSPFDIGFLALDVGRLAHALYKGDVSAVKMAAVDVGLSAVGVVVPIPGAGQALKVLKTAKFAEQTNRRARTASRAKSAVENVAKGEKPRIRVKDVTDPGAKQRNYEVDWSKGKFDQHLEDSGFSKGEIPTKKGAISVFSKNGNKEYTTRDFSTSTDGPTGEIFRGGEKSGKIRFKRNE